MHIGLDFDNTIVCYDGLFHRVCCERALIPPQLPVSKSEVRNYLRRAGREDAWTEMQGYVYGARMNEAEPYPGVLEFIRALSSAGARVSIISHKTRLPYLGEQYDLHQAAFAWLEQQGFFGRENVGLPREEVFFELTKEAKLRRIGLCGCTHFVDDLPEFLLEPAFPAEVRRVLLDPNNHYADNAAYFRVSDWPSLLKTFLPQALASRRITPAK